MKRDSPSLFLVKEKKTYFSLHLEHNESIYPSVLGEKERFPLPLSPKKLFVNIYPSIFREPEYIPTRPNPRLKNLAFSLIPMFPQGEDDPHPYAEAVRLTICSFDFLHKSVELQRGRRVKVCGKWFT